MALCSDEHRHRIDPLMKRANNMPSVHVEEQLRVPGIVKQKVSQAQQNTD